MKKNVCKALTFVILCAGVSMAQKGTAEPDYCPNGYSGDTFTGEVTAVNEDSREFTLTYGKGDKAQTIVGVLPKGYTVKMKDGRDHEIQMLELVGERIKAYYVTRQKRMLTV